MGEPRAGPPSVVMTRPRAKAGGVPRGPRAEGSCVAPALMAGSFPAPGFSRLAPQLSLEENRKEQGGELWVF